MTRSERDAIIVRSTTNLAHNLGLTVVAEGVEDAATLERLAQFGCDEVQGFHIARLCRETRSPPGRGATESWRCS